MMGLMPIDAARTKIELDQVSRNVSLQEGAQLESPGFRDVGSNFSAPLEFSHMSVEQLVFKKCNK